MMIIFPYDDKITASYTDFTTEIMVKYSLRGVITEITVYTVIRRVYESDLGFNLCFTPYIQFDSAACVDIFYEQFPWHRVGALSDIHGTSIMQGTKSGPIVDITMRFLDRVVEYTFPHLRWMTFDPGTEYLMFRYRHLAQNIRGMIMNSMDVTHEVLDCLELWKPETRTLHLFEVSFQTGDVFIRFWNMISSYPKLMELSVVVLFGDFPFPTISLPPLREFCLSMSPRIEGGASVADFLGKLQLPRIQAVTIRTTDALFPEEGPDHSYLIRDACKELAMRCADTLQSFVFSGDATLSVTINLHPFSRELLGCAYQSCQEEIIQKCLSAPGKRLRKTLETLLSVTVIPRLGLRSHVGLLKRPLLKRISQTLGVLCSQETR